MAFWGTEQFESESESNQQDNIFLSFWTVQERPRHNEDFFGSIYWRGAPETPFSTVWGNGPPKYGRSYGCNYILILNKMLSEKRAKKNYGTDNKNTLSFSKGNVIQIYKENLGWSIGRTCDGGVGYFPLKYVSLWSIYRWINKKRKFFIFYF